MLRFGPPEARAPLIFIDATKGHSQTASTESPFRPWWRGGSLGLPQKLQRCELADSLRRAAHIVLLQPQFLERLQPADGLRLVLIEHQGLQRHELDDAIR